MKPRLGAGALLLLAGCLNVADSANTITLNFDFNSVGEGYIAGASDFPEARLADVGLVGDLRTLPSPLVTARKALYLSGTNVTGTMFLFFQKRVTGLQFNTSYKVTLGVQYATKYHTGCTTGPGPSSYIKAGVSLIEPLAVADQQGILRMSINKGTGTSAGDYTQLGDIRNGLTGCPASGTYNLQNTISRDQPLTLVTDEAGGFWLWLGIDSNSLGAAEIYVTGLSLALH